MSAPTRVLLQRERPDGTRGTVQTFDSSDFKRGMAEARDAARLALLGWQSNAPHYGPFRLQEVP